MTRSTVVNYSRTQSQAISKYVKPIYATAKSTGVEYFARLLSFEKFIKETYDFAVDDLTIGKVVSVDVYDLLSSYVSWLSSQTDENGLKSLSGTSIKNRVIIKIIKIS